MLFRSTWDLPGPGLEPVSPALVGRFLTTAPPGKSLYIVLVEVREENWPHRFIGKEEHFQIIMDFLL